MSGWTGWHVAGACARMVQTVWYYQYGHAPSHATAVPTGMVMPPVMPPAMPRHFPPSMSPMVLLGAKAGCSARAEGIAQPETGQAGGGLPAAFSRRGPQPAWSSMVIRDAKRGRL